MMKTVYVKFLCILLTVLILLFSCGCTEHYFGVSTEPDSLKVLTPEEIESIFAEISYEVTEKYQVVTNESGDDIVFWLDGGSVWHISQDCSTVKKADISNVNSGSVQDALSCGKERPCKICGKNYEYSENTEHSVQADISSQIVTEQLTEKYPKEYDKDGDLIVFWLESSKVWHESRYCSSLSRSDPNKIIQGSVEDGIAAGKERACKNCAD